MQKDPVYITGSEGWLGTNLLLALENGIPGTKGLETPYAGRPLHCLVHKEHQRENVVTNDRINNFEGDLRSQESCFEFMTPDSGGTLFHIAGIIHPKRISDLYEVNTKGTENILNAAVRAGVKRAVIMSSNSPIGCNPHVDHLFDENSEYNPYMGYGRSKQLMEETVHRFQAEGKIETVIIRGPWFYGPHQPARQVLFFQMIRDGKGPILGSGENRRSMAYVDNLCQGFLLAGSHPAAAGQTYWIADERPYSMNEIVDTVERLLEQEFGFEVAHKRLRLPSLASEIALLVDKIIQRCGLYHQKIHVLSEMNKTIACSISKAKRELGYKPTIELEEGMRRSIADGIARLGL